ncbi:MAG: hypothetical protein ACFWTN_00130 [Clostridium sp.]
MLHEIAEEISLKLVINKLIPIENRSFYTYGIELSLNDICILFSITLIALLLDKVIVSLLYVITYCVLRQYVGGYHCKTYMRCFSTTLILYILMLIFNTYLGSARVVVSYVLVGIAAPLIFILAPVHYRDDPDDDINRKKYRVRSLIWLFLSIIGFFLASLFHLSEISFAIAWGVFMVFLLMLPPVYMNLLKVRR